MAHHSTEPLSMKANMLWNSVGSLVFFGFQWLMTVAVVRISNDYEAAGVLALAMAVYNIIQPAAIYRMTTYQISDVKHEYTTGEYLTFRVLTTALATAAGVAYAMLTCPPGVVGAIVLYMLYRAATLIIEVLHATMQLNMRMDYIGISNALQGVGSFAVFCAAFYLTGSLEVTFAFMTIAIVLIGVFYDLPRTTIFEKIMLGMSLQKVKRLLAYCFPIVIAGVVCSAVPAIPRQYLSFAQGEAVLGIYASVAAPAVVIQMGGSYIYNPLLGAFASLFGDGERAAFLKLLAKVIAGIAAIGIVIGLALVVGGEWLVVLFFGPSIAEHAYLLIPVIASTVVTAFLWFFNDLLISVRSFTGVIAGNVIALAITFATTIPFVDAFGPNGISYVVVVAFVAGCIVELVFLKRIMSSLLS